MSPCTHDEKECASEAPLCRGNVIFGFEQANKYTVLNERGETVALLAEELGGLGRSIGRQLLRTRRPMTATVLSPDGGPDTHREGMSQIRWPGQA